MIDKDRNSCQMIHGNIKKSLDLVGMQVHRKDPVRPGLSQEVGHQFGCDGHAGLVFAVLPGIAEIGDHGGDAVSGSPFQGIDDDEQFEQVVVRRPAGRVDDEDIPAADALSDLYENLLIRKTADGE